MASPPACEGFPGYNCVAYTPSTVAGIVDAGPGAKTYPGSPIPATADTGANIHLDRRPIIACPAVLSRRSLGAGWLPPLFQRQARHMTKFVTIGGNQREIENEGVAGDQQIVRPSGCSRRF